MALAALDEIDPNAASPGSPPGSASSRSTGPTTPRGSRPSCAVAAARRPRPGDGAGPATLPADLAKLSSARSAPRAATSPAWSPPWRRPASWTSGPKALTAPEMARLLADVARAGRPGAGRGDLPPQGAHLPEVPRDRRRRRAGRPEPREHRRQRPARLPGRLDPPAQQGGQGELPRHRRRHRRRPGLHRDQGPPDRRRAGAPRRRGPRGRDPALLDRRPEDGRLAHAGGTGRRADPARAGRPRPVPLRAGQGRALFGGDPARLPALAGARSDPEARDALARLGPEGVLRDGRKLTWRPAYTMVNGLLPASEWDTASGRRPSPAPIGLARTQIQVTTGGKIKLAMDSTEGLSFYLDGRHVEPTREKDGAGALVFETFAGRAHAGRRHLGQTPRRDSLYPGGCPGLAGPGAGRAGEVSREESRYRDRSGRAVAAGRTTPREAARPPTAASTHAARPAPRARPAAACWSSGGAS